MCRSIPDGNSSIQCRQEVTHDTGARNEFSSSPAAASRDAFSMETLAPLVKSLDVQSVQGPFSWWSLSGTIGLSGQITEQTTPAENTTTKGSSTSRSHQIMRTEYTRTRQRPKH